MIGSDSGFVKIVHPVVMIEGRMVEPNVEQHIVRTVVDTHLHLPDMFEITFIDDEGKIATDAGLRIGSHVEIKAGKENDESTTSIIKGEVTSIEAICEENLVYLVVRGYETAHRLQRAKRTRTFVNMTDSDIASQIARNAGLDIGDVQSTSVTHDHI